jgi:hypothetical protein
MIQLTAPLSTAIKVITGLTLGLAAAFCLGAVYLGDPVCLVPGLIVAGVSYGCYLYAPIAYELSGDRLIVRRRRGEREFGPVQGCSVLTVRPPWGLRLWGNGGLFAATGIFWNRAWGVFRAYVTSARHQDMVLVTTPDRKILISPERPEEFVQACG